MNIRVSSPRFVILALPLLVYGQVSITPYGTATDDTSYRLECSIPSFTGSGTWAKDGNTLTICTPTVCTVKNTSIYQFTSSASGIQVVMDPVSSIVDGLWKCTSSGIFKEINVTSIRSPISQMSTSIATEGTTSVNSIFELSNITLPMISGNGTTTSDLSASTSRLLNTGTTNFHSNTETTHFYAKTETTTPYANTETADFDANTQNNEIQTNTLRIISSSMSTYQSMFVTTVVNDILGSLDSISQIMTETFALPGYSSPSYYERTLPSRFETSNVFPQTFTVSSISFPVYTLSDDLFHNIQVSSGSLITTGSSEYSNLSVTISPLMSIPFIDPISYSSSMEDPSFSYHQFLTETSVTLPKISVSSQLPSDIIDTMNHFLYTTNTLITSYLDNTSILFDNFSNGYQTFSQVSSSSASTSLDIFNNSTDHHSSLQTTKYYYETMQTELPSYVTSPLYEFHTDNAATGIYSKEMGTSVKSYMQNSLMPSQTQPTSMNNIQDSKIDFQSTYFEPYSQLNNEFFSSKISKYLLSTLQSTSLLMPFNTKANVFGVESYMETTNMMTFESQSGVQTKDMTFITNPSSIQISAVSFDFKPTLLTTAINFNSKTMPPMIKPSSQRTNSDKSYTEIGTSFKDWSLFINSFSESVTSRELLMTTLSSEVIESINTLSTSTTQSVLSEKNKNIIFITSTSAVVTIILVILLMFFAKLYSLKPPEEGDSISWSNRSSPPKTAFPDYSVTGKRIYPLLNTSSTSCKMHLYEYNWNDIV